MEIFVNLFNLIFNSKRRKRKLNIDLDFVKYKIKKIRGEIEERDDEFVSHIHNNSVDKDSVFEQERHKERIDEVRYNLRLLKDFRKCERILMKKLGIAQTT